MVDRNEDLELLIRDLVRIETENPPGNEKPCAEFIATWLHEREIDAELVDVPDPNRPQVVAKIGDGDPVLVLNGHIDVVPAGMESKWTDDPYSGAIKNEKLYGRGSNDMKTGVALALFVAASLREEIEAGDLEGSLVLHAAMGEETADPGTLSLLEEGYDGDYGIVLESTDFRVATSEKGLAWYEITVEGEPSHASRPDQGSNAILHATHVLEALRTYDQQIREREDDLVGRAYATVTEFSAGTKENVLPERATLTVDRRFLPEESIDDIDREIEELLESVADEHGVQAEWRRTRTYDSAEISPSSEIAEITRKHAYDVVEAPTEPWGISASTDVRNMVNDAGMQAITWGPGDSTQAHTYDEHIDLEAAAAGLEILERVVRDVLGHDDVGEQ